MYSRLVFVAALVATTYVGRGLATTRDGSRTTSQRAVDNVIVDPSIVKRTIPAGFFGINSVGFWDGAAASVASARALAQTSIRTVRFPGGAPADWYDWQDPYYKGWSHTSPMQLWHYASTFGALRALFGTNYQGHEPNPPGKSFAVNSPQNAAAWVRYNQKTGINADMEIGNEEDINLMHKTDDPAYAEYSRRFNAQARAMHHANPRIRVLGPVGANEYYWWGLDGLGMFLAATGNRTGTGQVDGVSLHFYKGSSWLDTRGGAQYWLSHDGPWVAIQRMIHAHDTRKLPVYITEWNLGGADQNSAFNPTLGHALVNADMIGAFAVSGVAGQDYFDTHGGHTWGLLYGLGQDRPLDSPTPTYFAMALWSHMGDQVVPLQQTDNAATVMSTYATTRKNGSVQVLAINKQSSARKVTVAFQGSNPSGHSLHVYSLQGLTASVDDRDVRYNGVVMPSPQLTLPGPKRVGTVHGRTLSYSVPGYSAIILDLSGTSRNASIHWKPFPTAAPAPAVQFTVHGKVAHGALKPGDTQELTATVRSNEDVGSVLVDLEVYDDTNAKVFQVAKPMDLYANKPVTVSGSYAISAAAHVGTYHYDIGIFGPTWSPTYAWTSDVDKFTVAGA